MKRWMIAVVLLAGTGLAQGQSADTSRQSNRGGERSASTMTARRVDRFIDKDGDGICDGRASGLGVHRGGQAGRMNAGSGIGVPGQGHGRKLQKGRRP